MNRRNSGNNDGWEVSKINDSHQVIENTRHDTSGKKKKGIHSREGIFHRKRGILPNYASMYVVHSTKV